MTRNGVSSELPLCDVPVKELPLCDVPVKELPERDKIDNLNTEIHEWSLFWIDIGTSIKSGVVKLGLWAQRSPFSECEKK